MCLLLPLCSLHLLCQLALYIYHNHCLLPNCQPIMLAHFHAGRHDMVQLASASIRAFCEAAPSNGKDSALSPYQE